MDPNTGRILMVDDNQEVPEHLKQIKDPSDVLEAKRVLGDSTKVFIDDTSPQLTKLQKSFRLADKEDRRKMKRQQRSKAKKEKRTKNQRNGWQK